MKKFRILAIIGYVLIVIGIGVLSAGFVTNGSGNPSMTIPAGSSYFAYIKTESSMWMNAHLEGTVTVQGGGTVDVMVLNAAQYIEYSQDLLPSSSIWSSTGSTLSFSVDLPGSGAYYVVANHATGSSSVAQTVNLSYKMSGIDMLYVIPGAIVLAVGITLCIVSFRMQKKAVGATVPLATTSSREVKMFDNKQKLQ